MAVAVPAFVSASPEKKVMPWAPCVDCARYPSLYNRIVIMARSFSAKPVPKPRGEVHAPEQPAPRSRKQPIRRPGKQASWLRVECTCYDAQHAIPTLDIDDRMIDLDDHLVDDDSEDPSWVFVYDM